MSEYNKLQEDMVNFKEVVESTLSNYANMHSRLSVAYRRANFILIYYSLFLIIFSISSVYFVKFFNQKIVSYFSLVISIILLVYSLVNDKANYLTKISEAQSVISSMRNIKREIVESENILKKCKSTYATALQNADHRDELDFFATLKQRCKKYRINWITRSVHYDKVADKRGIDRVLDHLSEINPFILNFQLFLDCIWYVFLLCLPIVSFIISCQLNFLRQ